MMLLKLGRNAIRRQVFCNGNKIRFSSIEQTEDAPGMVEKLERLERDQPFFDRLLYFDPD